MTAKQIVQQLGERVRAARPRTILIVGWCVFLIYAYPGYMTSDAVDQLFDARVGHFNDWHPPTMIELWRLISYVVAGPFGMLAAQSWLLVGGAYALLARITRPRAAALGAVGLLIFPPVIAPLAVISPDAQMVGYLLAGFACVTSPRRGGRLAGVVLLVLGTAMRPTAALAALPLLAGGIRIWRPATLRWRRALAGLAACAAIWLAACGLDAYVRHGSTEHTKLDRAIADLTGTAHFAPPFDDDLSRALLAGIPTYEGALRARLANAYTHPDRLTYGTDRMFEMPHTAAQRALVFDAAWAMRRAYPAAYLLHRWRTFGRVLGLSRTKDSRAVYTGFAGSESQGDKVLHAAMHSALQRGAIAVVRVIANGRANRPYLYLILAVLALPIAIRRRHAPAGTLLASGILYELSLFFATTVTTYAISSWLIVTTSLAVGLILRNELARRRSAQGSSSSSAS